MRAAFRFRDEGLPPAADAEATTTGPVAMTPAAAKPTAGPRTTGSPAMIDFDKAGGLVPAVAQDADTGEVLMLAWMNREAFDETVRTGRAVYFSRSRNKLWRKGEESGHVQEVRGVYVDCDADTVLLKVKQVGGAACHEGYKSCFFRELRRRRTGGRRRAGVRPEGGVREVKACRRDEVADAEIDQTAPGHGRPAGLRTSRAGTSDRSIAGR